MRGALMGKISLFILFMGILAGADTDFQLARVKYRGGGDWYNDPDVLPNLAAELRKRAGVAVAPDQAVVDVSSREIFNYPFLYLTGHGNIRLTEDEAKNLREYLENGGFLYADDDYGMDESFRREIKKVFPDRELVELPFDHPIYHLFYDFPKGLPKIHEHRPGPPHGYGIFIGDRMVVYYTYNTNISDGWTPNHNDPPEKREAAFKMGINIVLYSLTY